MQVLARKYLFPWSHGFQGRNFGGFIEDRGRAYLETALHLTSITWKNRKFSYTLTFEESFQELKGIWKSPQCWWSHRGPLDLHYTMTLWNKDLGRVDITWRGSGLYIKETQGLWDSLPYSWLELATVMFAMKIEKHYLYGIHCDIYTDHKSLKYIFTMRDLNVNQGR